MSGCARSARAGRTPAIKIAGPTPENHPTLYRDKASTVAGNVGFGLRYQLPGGGLGSYLKNGDYGENRPGVCGDSQDRHVPL
ncbi:MULTISPECIES: hypothetical protein [Photorhabdus]|uniref:hypothetical protein n=1 Tax=Photorhabdus TaxID=29487 RepID=UPI00032340DC|nr:MULTISPECIES: hypothetical protein [Photorhabdus]